MGRGPLQWWENGARVNNELETADHSYRNQLLDICRASEDMTGLEDRSAGRP